MAIQKLLFILFYMVIIFVITLIVQSSFAESSVINPNYSSNETTKEIHKNILVVKDPQNEKFIVHDLSIKYLFAFIAYGNAYLINYFKKNSAPEVTLLNIKSLNENEMSSNMKYYIKSLWNEQVISKNKLQKNDISQTKNFNKDLNISNPDRDIFFRFQMQIPIALAIANRSGINHVSDNQNKGEYRYSLKIFDTIMSSSSIYLGTINESANKNSKCHLKSLNDLKFTFEDYGTHEKSNFHIVYSAEQNKTDTIFDHGLEKIDLLFKCDKSIFCEDIDIIENFNSLQLVNSKKNITEYNLCDIERSIIKNNILLNFYKGEGDFLLFNIENNMFNDNINLLSVFSKKHDEKKEECLNFIEESKFAKACCHDFSIYFAIHTFFPGVFNEENLYDGWAECLLNGYFKPLHTFLNIPISNLNDESETEALSVES